MRAGRRGIATEPDGRVGSGWLKTGWWVGHRGSNRVVVEEVGEYIELALWHQRGARGRGVSAFVLLAWGLWRFISERELWESHVGTSAAEAVEVS